MIPSNHSGAGSRQESPRSARASRFPPGLLPKLLLLGVLGLALLLCASRPLPTNDYSIYVAMGRQMLAQGGLLEHDPFTFTIHGQRFINASWGYSLLCALSHQLTGYQGIRALNALALIGTLAGSFLLCRRAGASAGASAIATLYHWLLLLQNAGPRGQTLVYPLFVALALLLHASLRPWLLLLLGAAIAWIWTQLHASFPAAVLYAGALAVGRAISARDARAGLPAACAALGVLVGSCLGPYGPEIWAYIYQNGEIPRHRAIVEWYPPGLRSFEGLRFYGALVLWAALMLRRPRSLSPSSWLLVLGFAVMGATATRLIAWFGLATALPLALRVSPAASKPPATPTPTSASRIALAGAGLLWLAVLAKGVPLQVELAPDTPRQLADALQEDAPSGRVFAPMEACGYLAQQVHVPAATGLGSTAWPYFLDMRVWIYDDEVWQEFMAISSAEPGWQERLDRWQVSHLLLSHSFHGRGLLPAAHDSAHWELLLEDEAGALFRRAAQRPRP